MGRAAGRFYLAVFQLLGACAAHPGSLRDHGPPSQDVCAIDPTSIVSDACASFSTLDKLNARLQPTLESLTQESDFFSYYRLNLYNKACPFWNDETSMCGNIACAVDTLENEEDIPLIWRTEELGKLEGPKAEHPSRKQQREERPLKGTLGADVRESCVVEYDDECDERDYCVPEDESATAKGDYVSLVDNPERFTGYSGPSANHVWEAIYRENCFSKAPLSSRPSSRSPPSGFFGLQQQAAADFRHVIREHEKQTHNIQGGSFEDLLELDDECLEKRVFYRIISGMHASISTHLCWDYLNQTTGIWGPNLQCYEQRLHHHPERISNLYFNFALMLRAVAKARDSLQGYTFCAGDPAQDRLTKSNVLLLADKVAGGPQIYDESLMFQDPTVVGLKDDFKGRFRNVSRTMDCVGCDKCRLWGKLQTAGYGAALKILFEFDPKHPESNPQLRRTELVALVNTLDKISHSLSAIQRFTNMIEDQHHAVHDHTASRSSTIFARAQEQLDPQTPEPEPPLNSLEELDDDLYEESSRPELSLSEIFWAEFGDVCDTFFWVLERWAQLPQEVFNIMRFELEHLWNVWLGRSAFFQRDWGVRKAPPVERNERRRNGFSEL